MNKTTDDFAAEVIALAAAGEDFRPMAAYIPEGDCVEFFIKPDPFYARRLDDLVTVYYSQETDEVVGSLIKGISGFRDRLLEKMPGFRIEIDGGKVKLEHIFRAKTWTATTELSDLETKTYRLLTRAAGESGVEAELCGA